MARALRCARILEDLPLREVDEVILDWLADKLAEQGLESASINRHMSALSKLLRWAERRRIILRAPKAHFRREPKGRDRTLSSEEIAKVLGWFEKNAAPAYGSFICFLLETGLRCGEAHTLRWEDCSADPQGRRWVTPKDTKNGDSRSVPLSKAAYKAMLKADSQDMVWSRVNRGTLSYLWTVMRVETGLDRECVIHSLRHTRASILVNAGVPIAHIQAWLGHRDIKTTMRYAHTDRTSLSRALDQMEKGERK